MKSFFARALAAAAFLALLALPASSQFADQATYVGAGGNASAITAALSNVSTLNDLVGVQVKIKASVANSAGATLSISGTTPVAIKRFVPGGAIGILAGDTQPGQVFSVVYDGTQYQMTSAPAPRAPTRSVLTGSGAYTSPTGAVAVSVRMWGAGGGGGGSGATPTDGTAGAATTFGTVTASGGPLGGKGDPTNPGTSSVCSAGGGTVSLRIPCIAGQSGAFLSTNNSFVPGGFGGSTVLSGGGLGGRPLFGGASGDGHAATPGTGAGGGGGGNNQGSYFGAAGGASGEYVELILPAPVSVSYAVGTKGTGGTGSFAGGVGADGGIQIEELYQ